MSVLVFHSETALSGKKERKEKGKKEERDEDPGRWPGEANFLRIQMRELRSGKRKSSGSRHVIESHPIPPPV